MYFDRSNYINLPVPIEGELKLLFRGDDPITIFEIGACEGEDGIKYARLFPKATIYAFEPLPGNIKLMEHNYAKYQINNIQYFNKALSEENGTAEFYVSEGRPEGVPESDWDYGNKSSSLLPPDKHLEMTKFIKFKNKIIVETEKIETFCVRNNIQVIDFIHMDVQGAELLVLKGAGNMISNIKAIWLEVANVSLYKGQPLATDIEAFMAKMNFVLAKNCLEDVAGDQLYISKKYFPEYKKMFSKTQSKGSFIRRVLKKLGVI
jgi:FkbM family methyltransferase